MGILDRIPSLGCVSGASIDHPSGISCAGRWAARGISEGVYLVSPATSARLLAAMVPFMSPPTPCSGPAPCAAGAVSRRAAAVWRRRDALVEAASQRAGLFSSSPIAEIHRESSALSGNYAGPRPVEPFLTDPDALRGVCPAPLRPLLERFYAIRACKQRVCSDTGANGAPAAALVRRFVAFRDWRAPLLVPALIAGTPLGAVAAWSWRKIRLHSSRTSEAALPGATPRVRSVEGSEHS